MLYLKIMFKMLRAIKKVRRVFFIKSELKGRVKTWWHDPHATLLCGHKWLLLDWCGKLKLILVISFFALISLLQLCFKH
jgi:hypothetical protein